MHMRSLSVSLLLAALTASGACNSEQTATGGDDLSLMLQDVELVGEKD